MAAGKSNKSLVSFNAGEFSPLLEGRLDLEKAGNACRVLENFIIQTYGCAIRRPGMQFIAVTKDDEDKKSTLWTFQLSVTTTFTIEVGEEYMRFYANGAQIVTGTIPVPYEIETPYAEQHIFEVQYKQINDVIYAAHPLYPPFKLSRFADDDWEFEEVIFDVPPTLDPNIDKEFTVTPTPTSNPSEVALEFSKDILTANHVGAYWRIGHVREASSQSRAFSSGNGSMPVMTILGTYNVRTYGTWNAKFRVERTFNGVDYEVVREVEGQSDRNVDIEGTAEKEADYRVTVFDYISSTGAARVVLESVDATVYGTVRITAVTDAQNAVADVLEDLYDTSATDIWAEGAWSNERGFPRAVTIHEQRLSFGGIDYLPQSVWMSVIGDYENFLTGTGDDASLFFTLSGEELNIIQWMISQKELLIGTSGNEWAVGSRSTEKALTPSTIHARIQSALGSEYIQALLTNNVILFVQRKSRKVIEMVYSFEAEQFVVNDLTLLSEHVTVGGIVKMALQRDPLPILWCVTGEGQLIALTYERNQNVVGWHRHPTQGNVESVATIYGDNSEDDEVWFVVKRDIDGVDRRYVERFNPARWTDKEDAFFVDSGLTYEGAPATVISGLDHLEDMEVVGLADGAVVGPFTVSNAGAITLTDAASVVHLGLPFTSKLKPVRLDTDPILGVTMGQFTRITQVVARLKTTLGLSFDCGDGRTYQIPFRSTSDPMDSSPPLFTGDKKLEIPTNWDFDTPFSILQTQPLPCTLIALTVFKESTQR